MPMSIPTFTKTEERILALAGGDLPLSAAPFRDIAEQVGCDEAKVVELLNRLKEQGIIRRFGATLRHQKAGYGFNAMVAWIVKEDSDRIGKIMAARPEISHCYRRRTYPQWPYNLYTMIHGKSEGQCMEVAAELSAETGITDYTVLRSLKELKKTSMRYFK